MHFLNGLLLLGGSATLLMYAATLSADELIEFQTLRSRAAGGDIAAQAAMAYYSGEGVPADGAPQRVNGFMSASTAPGLGIKPKMDVLGKRVVEVS